MSAKIKRSVSIDVCWRDLKGQDIIDFAEEIKAANGANDPVKCEVTAHEPDHSKGQYFTKYDVILTHSGPAHD
jgi:hypothetical protein